MADPVFPDPAPTPLPTKEEVDYRYAAAGAEGRAVKDDRCENCNAYHPGVRNMNTCDRVFGLVHANYTCNLFAPKEVT